MTPGKLAAHFLAGLLLAAAGCVRQHPYVPFPVRVTPALGEPDTGYAAVRVYYATDRDETDASEPARRFGGRRSASLKLGSARVSIPERHGRGVLELPGWTDCAPQRHCCLVDVEPPCNSDAEFWAELRTAVELSARREVLLYVHGYNNTFEAAALRTAQIAHDIRFDGPAVVYTWASQGLLAGFGADVVNTEWTEPYLVSFLDRLLRRSGAQRVQILAHSMGTRAVVRSVRELVRQRGAVDAGPEFDQVVLAAADVDAEIFARDYAPSLADACNRVTLYYSTADWALRFGSQALYGYARLGSYGPDSDPDAGLPGIEVIDATPVDRGIVGHMYYGDSPAFLADLQGVIAGVAADQRPCLTLVGGHYEFTAAAADSGCTHAEQTEIASETPAASGTP
jgi:esterase/lipase superfamily enzyme